jgi:hypothetical protein
MEEVVTRTRDRRARQDFSGDGLLIPYPGIKPLVSDHHVCHTCAAFHVIGGNTLCRAEKTALEMQ